MRRLVVSLLLLGALGVALDRGALVVTQSVVAQRMQESGQLSSRPQVHVRGFPFLLQAVRGRYDRIDVDAQDVRRDGAALRSLDVRLTGAQVPLSEALRGDVTSVPVGGLTATAVVSYLELAAQSGLAGVTVAPADGGLRVTAQVKVLGQTVTARATSTLTLRGSSLEVRARSVSVLGARSDAVDRALASRLDFTVRLDRLPYGLHLDRTLVGPQGVLLQASAGPTVIRTAG